MPSRYEPCGLNQMYSLRYGTVPVVRATGGLADTVEEGPEGTGFRFEAMFAALANRFPAQVAFKNAFSNQLAHLIEAGADMFLMPSFYEPCGLNQMYSLRYGTVPIVHKTGGLADTVRPETGFLFEQRSAVALARALEAALATFRDEPAWTRRMQLGMAENFSWTTQGALYEQLYERLRR
ncbi:MAG TPA: glycosyltransferase, partial [Kofleriaceae bacterium]|nr:glycosyltransferase [Kofleriaceae bacterium]